MMRNNALPPVSRAALFEALQHRLGNALWELGRRLILEHDRAAWASTLPVLPLTLCLQQAHGAIDALRCFESSVEGPRDDGAELELADSVLRALESAGSGTSDNAVRYCCIVTGIAVGTLRRHSPERAMCLRLLASSAQLAHDPNKCAFALAQLRDAEATAGTPQVGLVFACRRHIVEGDLALEKRWTYADGIASRVSPGPARDKLRSAMIHYVRAVRACEELRRRRFPYPAHAGAMARYKLWTVAIAAQDWRRANRAWRALMDENHAFVFSDLAFLPEFALYVGDFAFAGGVDQFTLEEVEACLNAATEHVFDEEHRISIENAFVRLSDALVVVTGTAPKTSPTVTCRPTNRQLRDQLREEVRGEHYPPVEDWMGG